MVAVDTPADLLATTALHLTLAALIPGIRFFNLALICTFLLFLPSDHDS